MPKSTLNPMFVNSYPPFFRPHILSTPLRFRRSPKHPISRTPGGRWKVRAMRNGDWKAYVENYNSNSSSSYAQYFSSFNLAVRYAHAQSKVCHLLKDDIEARRTSQYFVRRNFLELEQLYNEERNRAEMLRLARILGIEHE